MKRDRTHDEEREERVRALMERAQKQIHADKKRVAAKKAKRRNASKK
jgi:hypothetical protein